MQMYSSEEYLWYHMTAKYYGIGPIPLKSNKLEKSILDYIWMFLQIRHINKLVPQVPV